MLKKAEKKLLVGDRRVIHKTNKRNEKGLYTSLNQGFLRVCTKNYDRAFFTLYSSILINLKSILALYRNRSINSNCKDGSLL